MSEFLELHHLSASNINKFITNRAAWFASYFLKMPFNGNIHTIRGQAVETGIIHYVLNGDLTAAIGAGVKDWEEKIVGIEDNIDFKQSIGPLIKVAIEGTDDEAGYKELISQFGKPTVSEKQQEKISIVLDGCSIPVIGYLDFPFKKRIVDNKVSGKSPSCLSQDYIVQGSIYRKATGLPVFFFFEVANKKPVIKVFKLSDEEYEFGISLATKAAQAIERILANPIDGDLMRAFLFADPSGGYNKDEQMMVYKMML